MDTSHPDPQNQKLQFSLARGYQGGWINAGDNTDSCGGVVGGEPMLRQGTPWGKGCISGGPWRKSILPWANDSQTRLGMCTGGEGQTDCREALVFNFLSSVSMAPVGNVAFSFPFLIHSYHISTPLVSYTREKKNHTWTSIHFPFLLSPIYQSCLISCLLQEHELLRNHLKAWPPQSSLPFSHSVHGSDTQKVLSSVDHKRLRQTPPDLALGCLYFFLLPHPS